MAHARSIRRIGAAHVAYPTPMLDPDAPAMVQCLAETVGGCAA
jgi:hypothetical protein